MWEMTVERLGEQRSGGRTRTYGRYEVRLSVSAAPELTGFICESPGPGDNQRPGNAKRVEAGTYPVWTQFGSYRSIGYSNDDVAGALPMPAIALAGTGKRDGILVHPAHPPNLFLSSIGCLNPTSDIAPGYPMDFYDSRRRTIELIESLRRHAPKAFEHEVMTRVPDAVVIIKGEPGAVVQPAAVLASAPAEPPSLPISKKAALAATQWLLTNFEKEMRAGVKGKPYKLKHVCAIACQETAYKWVPWIDKLPVATIVERAVYDGSGDYPGTSRSAFPVDTAAFRAKMGDAFADMLIEEANKTRRLQGWSDKPWVYKGYGLFQYDLQYVVKDRAWFEQRKWYDFQACMDKLTFELDRKLSDQNGDLWEAIRAYNGSGTKAEAYREKVRTFTAWAAELTGG